MTQTALRTRKLVGLAIGMGLLCGAVLTALPSRDSTESYIVQGASLANARAAVEALGGEITHELGIIRCTSLHNNAT